MDHFVDTQNSSLPFHYDVLEWWLISNSLNYWLFCIILSKKLCTECEFCNIFQSEEATLNSIISAKYASILISKVSSELLTSWSFQNCPWWSELTRKCVHKMGLKVNAWLFMTFTVCSECSFLFINFPCPSLAAAERLACSMVYYRIVLQYCSTVHTITHCPNRERYWFPQYAFSVQGIRNILVATSAKIRIFLCVCVLSCSYLHDWWLLIWFQCWEIFWMISVDYL